MERHVVDVTNTVALGVVTPLIQRQARDWSNLRSQAERLKSDSEQFNFGTRVKVKRKNNHLRDLKDVFSGCCKCLSYDSID